MIHGKNHIGFELSANGSESIQSVEAKTWTPLSGDFFGATQEELEKATSLAQTAFETYRNLSGNRKAEFLEAIAEEIEGLGNVLVERAMAESGLPEGRIMGERGRTTGQLRSFARLLKEGSWVQARIETAMPDRAPLPKPDMRKISMAIGPVAVFTASNFPLAFSTAGGDTASALAAGCPVIVKAHESHLGTNQLVSDAIIAAAKRTGMPEGVFGNIQSVGYEMAGKLVADSNIKAVGFTGSQKGGLALEKIAKNRPEPIPVYAEMGSVNPVWLLPNKIETNAEEVATLYAGSITMGAGQFCTNPGILIGLKNNALQTFKNLLAEKLDQVAGAVMLNEGIAKNFSKKKAQLIDDQVSALTDGSVEDSTATASLVSVSGRHFLNNPNLHEEVFGPLSIIVECENDQELLAVTKALTGQLTLSIMATDADIEKYGTHIQSVNLVAGRLIINGAPTGVEVCYAMHHGGGYPASTDAKFTSVGQDAIQRFVKPISFQNFPQSLLPEELKNENKLGIMRLVNESYTREAIK